MLQNINQKTPYKKSPSVGIFQEAHIRGVKMYNLIDHDGEQTKKMKGLSRVVREKLTPAEFGPWDDDTVYSRWKLAPTRSLQIGLSVDTRKINSALNFKRFSLVS